MKRKVEESTGEEVDRGVGKCRKKRRAEEVGVECDEEGKEEERGLGRKLRLIRNTKRKAWESTIEKGEKEMEELAIKGERTLRD